MLENVRTIQIVRKQLAKVRNVDLHEETISKLKVRKKLEKLENVRNQLEKMIYMKTHY